MTGCQAIPRNAVNTPNVEALARMARTVEERHKFQALYLTWIRLAAELDRVSALIEAAQQLEKEQPDKEAE